jgi:hypothetical protein
MFFSVFDKVVITSEGFAFALVRGVKMAAKASSVTVLGKPFVVEIGRWREKNADAVISAKNLMRWKILNSYYFQRLTHWRYVLCTGHAGQMKH